MWGRGGGSSTTLCCGSISNAIGASCCMERSLSRTFAGRHATAVRFVRNIERSTRRRGPRSRRENRRGGTTHQRVARRPSAPVASGARMMWDGFPRPLPRASSVSLAQHRGPGRLASGQELGHPLRGSLIESARTFAATRSNGYPSLALNPRLERNTVYRTRYRR
jgi:hypothetical protein